MPNRREGATDEAIRRVVPIETEAPTAEASAPGGRHVRGAAESVFEEGGAEGESDNVSVGAVKSGTDTGQLEEEF